MKARYLKTTAVLILSAVLLTVGFSLTPAADLLCELSITANAQGEITSISSVSEWNSFANSVNNGATYEGVTVTLNSDISGVTTTVGTETNTFKGTFDGNHKTLSVNINDTSAQGTAPFRYIADATIKDLTVMGTVTGTTHAAGLVGFNWSGSSLIENCVVNTSVSVTTGSNRHMGGVVGHGKTAALTMKNTVFSGSMTNNQNYAGGLLGWSDGCTLTIDNCFFTGSYTGTGSFHPIAVHYNNKAMTTDVKNCYYTEAPTLTNTNYIAADGVEAYTVRPWIDLFCKLTVPDGSICYAPATVLMSSSKYTYTGSPINVSYMVTDPYNNILKNGIDYTGTISPMPVRDIGTYTLSVTGEGGCVGSRAVSFNVTGTAQTSADYLALDDTIKTASAPITLTSSSTGWINGKWYTASSDVTITDRITVNGNVNLILCDGATLTCTKGITVSTGNSLTIWGQSAQTGKLLIKDLYAADAGIGGYYNDAKDSGELFFNGGIIDVQNNSSGNAIGGSLYGNADTIHINRGIIHAQSDTFYHGFTFGAGSDTSYAPMSATIEISEDMLITDPSIVLRKASSTKQYFYDTVNKVYPKNVTLSFGYNAVVSMCPNGTVFLDKYKTFAGDTVTITTQPDDGYVFGGLTVTDEYGNNVTVTDYSFTMPSAGVTVSASFLRVGTVTVSDDIEGGTVTAQPNTQIVGSPVEVTVSPALEHRLTELYYYDPDNTRIDITQTNGSYKFTMPAYDVNISAVFEKIVYSITKDEAADNTYGTVSFAPEASWEDTIELYMLPNANCTLTKLCYKTHLGEPVDITPDGNGQYSFVMPACNVTIDYDFTPCYTIAVEFGDTHADLAAMMNDVEGCTVNGTKVTMTVAAKTVWEAKDKIEEITQRNVWQPLFEQHTEPDYIYVTANGDCETNPSVHVGLKPMTEYDTSYECNMEGSDPCQNGQLFYIQWMRPFTGEASVTVSPLICGTEVTKSQSNGIVYSTPDPEITLSSNLTPGTSFLLWETSYDPEAHTTSSRFEGTAQGGAVYYVNYYFNMPYGYYCTEPNTQIEYRGAECLYAEAVSGWDLIRAVFGVTAQHEWAGGECIHCKSLAPSHYINIEPSEKGVVTAEANAPYTKSVKLNVTPNEGYALKTLTVTDADNNEIEVTNNQFTMPDKDVTVTAEFKFSDGVGARLVGHSISLQGDIGVNFYMELAPEIAQSQTAYMKFTIPSGSKTETKTFLVSEAEQKGGYYVFKCNVAAKEMTSIIKARIYDGYTVGDEYTYSVKEYADYLLAHADGNGTAQEKEYARAADLVKKMLNYGAYSQTYFGTHTDSLANASLDEADKTLGEVTITHSNAAVTNLPEGVTFEGASLSLKSETTLSLFFKKSSESDVTFKLGDNTIVPIDNNGYLQIKITGIKAKQLSSDFTVTVGDSGSVTYSPMNYCQLVLSGSYTDELKNVVKALYKYSQAADSYFNVS